MPDGAVAAGFRGAGVRRSAASRSRRSASRTLACPRDPPPPRASSPGCRCVVPTRERAAAVARRPSAAKPVRRGRSRRHCRRRSGWPCRAGSAGRPAMSRASACASTVARTEPEGKARGSFARACAKCAACTTVLAADGTRRLNSPDCGMQITLQTSQSARSFTSNDERAEGRRHGDGHRQQQGPFVAVVDERPDRQALRCGPLDRLPRTCRRAAPSSRWWRGRSRPRSPSRCATRARAGSASRARAACRATRPPVRGRPAGRAPRRSSPPRLALTPGKARAGSAIANDAGWTWALDGDRDPRHAPSASECDFTRPDTPPHAAWSFCLSA